MPHTIENPPTLDVSIVVPVFNEVESLDTLYAEISAAMNSLGRSYEILFVNDGSSDGSTEKLDELSDKPEVAVVHMRRNFGKSSALAAAFSRVRGEVVITLDADLQDDPAMIPDFLARIDNGADLVSGWKRKRHDPADKRWPSKLFNLVQRRMSGVDLHDFNCGFKAYRLDCVRELNVYGGFHRFLPVLAGDRGFRIEEQVVNHRARKFGHSKYGFRRVFDGLFDFLTVILITKYRSRPLHFFGIPGGVLASLGVLLCAYLSCLWLFGQPIGHRPLLSLGVLLIITGGQFMGIGLLGELLVRNSMRPEEVYSVRAEKRGPVAQPAAPATLSGPAADRSRSED